MNINNNLQSYYSFFCEAEGNDHIASEFAIARVLDLIKTFKPDRILEIGLGIGSISGTVLGLKGQENGFKYYGTEGNPFCLKALKVNMGEDFSSLQVYKDISALPKSGLFDLIIVDGKDENFSSIGELISERGIIVIEGDRLPQLGAVQNIFPNSKFVHLISLKKNRLCSPFSSAHWQGGVKVILVNPDQKQKSWYLKNKFISKGKYWLRKII